MSKIIEFEAMKMARQAAAKGIASGFAPKDTVILDALEAAEHALDALDPRGGKLVHPPVTEVIDEAMFLVKSALEFWRGRSDG